MALRLRIATAEDETKARRVTQEAFATVRSFYRPSPAGRRSLRPARSLSSGCWPRRGIVSLELFDLLSLTAAFAWLAWVCSRTGGAAGSRERL